MPRSLPPRLGRSAIIARRTRAAPAPRCFSAFSSRNPRFLAREFVRGSFLVRGASAFGGDCALRLRIHRGEATRGFAGHGADVAGIHTAVISVAAHRSITSAQRGAVSRRHSGAATSSAPLVHSFPWVGCIVWHYPSPAEIFEFDEGADTGHPSVRVDRLARLRAILMRKRQAAISGRERTSRRTLKNVDFSSLPNCVTPGALGEGLNDRSVANDLNPVRRSRRTSFAYIIPCLRCCRPRVGALPLLSGCE